jgi:hypothetical protein
MSLVHNERTKLTATWFNAVATALIAAGTFAPLAALLYGLTSTPLDRTYLAVAAFASLSIGLGVHMAGRAFLGRLRE